MDFVQRAAQRNWAVGLKLSEHVSQVLMVTTIKTFSSEKLSKCLTKFLTDYVCFCSIFFLVNSKLSKLIVVLNKY